MLGYEAAVVNGQLVQIPPAAGYNPISYGQAYTGTGYARQGVYSTPPNSSSVAMAAGGAGTVTGSTQTLPSATSGTGSPWSFTKSPLWMALIFLTVGLLMLQHVHYGKK